MRQAEFIGTIDQDGIGVRVINAGFNNRGAEQHVGALLCEITHDAFQFSLVHLAVANDDAGFRHQFGQTFPHVLDGVDFVV